MVIKNNLSAKNSLGQLNKNISKYGKQLAKITTGLKIVGAGDGASEYAISEEMRVRIRALGQNNENVIKGMNLLDVAEGGIQNQISLLRTVKQKVIDAANDHNTDEDRLIIQKEINQCYAEIEDIAAETDYNDNRVLLGHDYWQRVVSWDKTSASEFLEDSGLMDVIGNVYTELDGIVDDFDVMEEYHRNNAAITPLGITATPQYFSGGRDGDPHIFEFDLSSYNSVGDLDNVGFSLGGRNYILTTDTSRRYSNTYNTVMIDIGGCSSLEDVASAIAGRVNYNVTSQASGKTVTFTTTNNTSAATSNSIRAVGYSLAGGTVDVPPTPAVAPYDFTASGTGAFSPAKNLSGGTNGSYNPYSDPDAGSSSSGSKAKLGPINISSAPSNSGITVSGSGTVGIVFVDGSSGFQYNSRGGYYTVGKNASGSISTAGMNINIGGGSITFTAQREGTAGNSYRVSDGYSKHIPGSSGSAGGTVNYTPVTAINSSVINEVQAGTDGTPATFDIDLGAYTGSRSMADLEAVIDDLYSRGLIISSGGNYEFGDSSILGLGTSPKVGGSIVDTASMRAAVSGGKSVAQAVGELLAASLPRASFDGTTVTLKSLNNNAAGNREYVYGQEGSLYHYDIDYGSWFAQNGGNFPSDLYGKGFRVYCATCNNQWFNFLFMPGGEAMSMKPESGSASEDIRTLMIDVSGVSDANSLVKAIYDQADPILTGRVSPYPHSTINYNHNIRVAADTKNGILTVYDARPYKLLRENYPNLQERGSKLADGVQDNVKLSMRELMAKKLVIQDTDKSSQHVVLNIPRTTLDHIFRYDPEKMRPTDYNVYNAAMRDDLLGYDNKQGILDRGLQYLLDAATLVGSQHARLETDAANITNAHENLTSAESTIRDADMAKEMTAYVKANVLSEASQAMLSQANQNSSSVLSLLG